MFWKGLLPNELSEWTVEWEQIIIAYMCAFVVFPLIFVRADGEIIGTHQTILKYFLSSISLCITLCVAIVVPNRVTGADTVHLKI